MVLLRLIDLLNTLLGPSQDRWHEVPVAVQVTPSTGPKATQEG